jgi:hypothetical protein
MALIPDVDADATRVELGPALAPQDTRHSVPGLLSQDEAMPEDGEPRPGAKPAGEQAEAIDTRAPRPRLATGVLSLEGVDARSVGVLTLACTALWFYDLFLLAAGA